MERDNAWMAEDRLNSDETPKCSRDESKGM